MSAGDQAQAAEAAPRRSHGEALASSVPDDNHILMRMLRMLLQPSERTPRWMVVLTGPMGAAIILIYVVAKWGVPAILAAQTLILQLHGDRIKLDLTDREIARQQATATSELLTAVQGIAGKLDEQGAAIKTLSAEVAGVKAQQAAASQRLNALQAQQQVMQRELRDR